MVALILAYIISFVIAIGVALSAFDSSISDLDDEYFESMILVVVISAVPTVMTVALVFLLIKRQNDHYSREARLRSAIMNLIRTAAWSPERENDVAPEIRVMTTAVRRQEKPRNPWFWSLILLVPSMASYISLTFVWSEMDTGFYEGDYANIRNVMVISFATTAVSLVMLAVELYLLYFLTKTMLEHDARWGVFAYNSGRALVKLGFPTNLRYDAPQLPERSMPLYIILTLFTGIFLLYWTYVLIRDPNEHFAHHRKFEDNLMATMTRPRYAIAVPADVP